MMNPPVNRKNGLDVYLEGWLLKKKSNDSSLMFKSHNQRWFRLQDVQGQYNKEIALCYYQNQKENDAKGWIYMKDVTAIQEEKKTFTIISHARTMILEATTAAEHNGWLAELQRACPQLLRRAESRESASTVATSSATSAKDHQSPPVQRPAAKGEDPEPYITLNHEALQSLDAKSSNRNNSSNNNTMDRSVSLFSRHAQGERNSFYNAQGKPNVPIVHSASGEENYREEELLTIQPDLTRSTDSISGLLESEQRQLNNSNKINNNNNNHMLSHRSGSRDREREGHPPRPRTDSRGHFPANYRDNNDETDNVSEGSGSRRSASHHTQDDHRKHGYRHGGDTTSSTNRLHRHIAQQNTTQEREEYYPANVTTTTSASNSRQTSANSSKNNHNNAMNKSHSGEEYYHHRSETKDSGEDEEVEDVSLRVRRRPSSRTSRDECDASDAPTSNAFSDTNNNNGTNSNAATSNNTNNTNASIGRKFSKKAPPPPSVAPLPPRRARDTSLTVLDNDEDNNRLNSNNSDNNYENSNNNVTRKSIDAILFQGYPSMKAEEKTSDCRNDDEDDIDIDFKAEYARYSESKGVSPDMGRPPKHRQPTASTNNNPNMNNASPPTSFRAQHNSNTRAGTPPRSQGHAGPQADKNFVSENWDENDPDDDKANNSTINNDAEAKETSNGKRLKAKGLHNPTAMMADPNWLEENFDD